LAVAKAAFAFVVSDTATPPALSGAEPRTVVPSMKVTVPVAFGLGAVTFAVKVTPVCRSCAGALATIVVTVGIFPTTWVSTAEVAELELESPPYDAVTG
jgi:hypothetical protein